MKFGLGVLLLFEDPEKAKFMSCLEKAKTQSRDFEGEKRD
jgi:hypothetical protein